MLPVHYQMAIAAIGIIWILYVLIRNRHKPVHNGGKPTFTTSSVSVNPSSIRFAVQNSTTNLELDPTGTSVANIVVDNRGTNTDEIHVSGDIPLVGPGSDIRYSDDIHKSKTQRIPTISPDAVGGGGGEKIVVADHVMASFYQKLADPASYGIWSLVQQYCASRGGEPALNMAKSYLGNHPLEFHVVYDTNEFPVGILEQHFFAVPRGQAGKTALETNIEIGGFFIHMPYSFFARSIILRLQAKSAKDDRGEFFEKGILQLEETWSRRQRLEIPLSMFTPLNPFDQDPAVFFFLLDPVLITPYYPIALRIYFPGGTPRISAPVRARLEVPGLRAYLPL